MPHPCEKGKTQCRFRGEASTGPKTQYGFETRKARAERAEDMRRLRELEDLGNALGIMVQPCAGGTQMKN